MSVGGSWAGPYEPLLPAPSLPRVGAGKVRGRPATTMHRGGRPYACPLIVIDRLAMTDEATGGRRAMPTIHITLLGRFAVTVDGVPVADSNWTPPPRRRAREGARPGARPAPPPRAGHRSRVARRHDRRGGAEAAQGGPLRPAGHRRAELGGAARRQRRCCAPTPTTTVDVVRVRGPRPPRARPTTTSPPPARRSRCYGGELLPEDRYEPWAEERREQLRLRHLDLLRLDGRWETVVELDPSDELAHLALMRRHAANGDRHAALAPVRTHGPHAAPRAGRRARPRGARAARPPPRRARRRAAPTTTR